jgi:hypothetical protein
LEGLLRVVSAKGADDVGKLAELFNGCSHASLSAFVDDAIVGLSEAAQPKPKNSRRSAKPKVGAAPSMPLSDYAAALSAAEADSAGFDMLVSRLRIDRTIKKPEMREIARLYLGYELAKKKGREDALDEIVERQKISARQSARGSLIDRLKPW